MGKSVLTPEENLLGKAVESSPRWWHLMAMGEREFGQHSETRVWGVEATKQLTTVGPG
jgi:hypothetical protein